MTLSRLFGLLLCTLSSYVHSLQLQGEWLPGGMLVGQVSPAAVVHFEGRRIALSRDGRFVVGLGRDAVGTVQLQVTENTEQRVYTYAVKPRQYAIQKIEGVPQRTVTPPPEVLERIREEAVLVRRARADNDRREDYLSGFVVPLEGPITGVYGSQRYYNGVPRSPHYGLDIARPSGTPVRAPAPGIVKLVHRDMYYSGGTLIIDHGFGITSTFIHLSDILIKAGERVETGREVALVGATGRATGPHLDWRINWFAARLDPALVLKHFPGQELTGQ